MLEKKEKKIKRHRRIKAKITNAKARPRLYVFRSNKHIYAQVIDDENGRVLAAASDLELKTKKSLAKLEKAKAVGKLVAEKSLEKKLKLVVFDRGGYKYHGRVKALAQGAREAGLSF